MAGRLSKEQKLKPPTPEHQEAADKWMETIGQVYKEIKDGCKANTLKKKREWDEDVFEESIVLCYEAIQRNGLKDTSTQGCKSYLFNAYNTNVLREATNPYTTRKEADSEVFFQTYDVIDENDAENKIIRESYNDFATMRILTIVEENFDSTSFYVFRLKYLIPKMSFRKLIALTNIKNAKARVKNVLDWLKENVSEKELEKEFEKYHLENNG